MMDVRHDWHAGGTDHQRAVAKRLYVVDYVEVMLRLELTEAHERTPAEGRHNGELAGATARQLVEVERMEEALRWAAVKEESAGLEQPVDAVRRHAMHCDDRIRLGPRGADVEVDIVAEAGEFAGHLRGVRPLASGVHVALVEEEEDFHG